MMFFVNLIFSRYDASPFAKNRLEITGFINVTSIILKAVLLTLAYTFLYPYIGYIGIIAVSYTHLDVYKRQGQYPVNLY